MRVTAFTKEALAVRRDIRDQERDGWEYVGEGGGDLWQLYRGSRFSHRITDVRIAACGKALWIKTANRGRP
ncbi:hypothetical protein EN866_34440 [Mesorhizobium sp. M2D.F.Ca.ET.223.01.1.1]|uniref:hypothetical protein n=1 Tax=Mesorhizobium sp. M2D.F.Ca.ET.223.01.1.1 TaxID=2563940 RepID=UPI0010925457|nr:hypothetical protein [Mesorhizobium sp. M2D.F.Ca.ET.223.01.1.1]TGR83030.1 hypothetical protein EN866_34440 [Mesorhizobium sp. M2D.F.Ca.ET.223.01.1.1]TGT65298.1 hypothetical protein EN802_31965 [bacterium M00.F.Ca.ET.159.01.1.1]TGT79409.1 hypothetical protein EN800_31305 [bacterium M00.F.Ca.ET.157.01.1.1]